MSSSALFWLVVALTAVPLLATPQGNRQSTSTSVVTSTTTATTTTTSTSTISTSTVCASYVNASTACRRRRSGGWLDTPILLSLDDDDSYIDYLNPSAIIGVQPTPLVMPRAVDLESSQSPVEEEKPEEGDDSFRVAEPIYFSQLAAIFPVLSTVFRISSTTFVTTTSTKTSVTSITTTTTTKPLVISGCIPPGFTYNKC